MLGRPAGGRHEAGGEPAVPEPVRFGAHQAMARLAPHAARAVLTTGLTVQQTLVQGMVARNLDATHGWMASLYLRPRNPWTELTR